MKVLRRKSQVALDDRLAALSEAADLAEGRLAQDTVARAREVVTRAGRRVALSVEHTVVALAGATGSGKSSLFNTLTGTEVATVGVTRPTTAKAQAALWSPEGSGPLLDWLDVPRRHTIDPGDDGGDGFDGLRAARKPGEAPLDGLILLDLPDHDSIERAHRLEVDRLVEVVDLLVWVLDPQKYADAAIHDRYLKPLARHRDVTMIVLNQVDRLPEEAVKRCLADLRRLLADDGLSGVPVLAVSARTGQGLAELREALGARVRDRHAWATRLAADAATAADVLAPTELPSPERRTAPGLDRALAEAAGVPLVAGAVAKGHRHRAVLATGWPVTRWLRRFRPDPLRRLHLGRGEGRTSLPVTSAVQTSKVETATRDAGLSAAEGLPEPWSGAVRAAARARSAELADRLDRAVSLTSVEATRRPHWWGLVNVLQWLFFATAVAGALWLGAEFAFRYLQLPDLPTPTLGEFPWPTTLLIGGALLGLGLAVLSRVAAWLGGRRRARKATKALNKAVAEVGAELIHDPIEAELTRYRTFAERVATARR